MDRVDRARLFHLATVWPMLSRDMYHQLIIRTSYMVDHCVLFSLLPFSRSRDLEILLRGPPPRVAQRTASARAPASVSARYNLEKGPSSPRARSTALDAGPSSSSQHPAPTSQLPAGRGPTGHSVFRKCALCVCCVLYDSLGHSPVKSRSRADIPLV